MVVWALLCCLICFRRVTRDGMAAHAIFLDTPFFER